MISLFNEPVYWVISHDMNPIAQRLADRHYSRKNPGWCFMKAGWKLVGENKTGKLRLFVKEALK